MIRAVSFDLWGTVIEHGDRQASRAWRLREFDTVLAGLGHRRPVEQIEHAIDRVYADAIERQRHGGQVSPQDQVAAVCARLGLPEDAGLQQVLTVVHTHAVLRACPQVRPGMRAALTSVRERALPVVLISNTLATSGQVTRVLLDYLDLAGLFDEIFLSGELGCAKPALEIFHTAVRHLDVPPQDLAHVGDDWGSDVLGAREAGLRAVWFKPTDQPAAPGTPWTDEPARIPELLYTLHAPDTGKVG